MKVISWVFSLFEFQSREYLFHTLDCSLRLLGDIAVLLGVYKLRIFAVGDCLTDVSTILVFVCKNRVILAEFQHIDGSARWLTSFNYNILRMQVLYLVLVIVDPRRSCCSACPVLQSKKHFVCRQKAAQIVLPPETDQ